MMEQAAIIESAYIQTLAEQAFQMIGQEDIAVIHSRTRDLRWVMGTLLCCLHKGSSKQLPLVYELKKVIFSAHAWSLLSFSTK